MDIENKEVSLVKQQATKALNAANELTIASQDDMVKATDLLSKIKTVGKMIKERKEQITKPLNEALSSARDLFRPIEDDTSSAEKVIKSKMLTFQAAEEAKARKEEERITARVEKGTMRPDTAAEKLQNITPAPTAVQGKVGAVKTMTIKKYRVTDETKLPREFLMPNMPAITEALKAGTVVPGAEMYEEKVISAR